MAQYKLNREILSSSLLQGRKFLLNAQKEAGNFIYEYNFITRTFSEDDNEVRQAGTLWGLALIHRYQPSGDTKQAIIRGLAFFDQHSQTENDQKRVLYPKTTFSKTGTVALIILTLVDFLYVENTAELRAQYEKSLAEYLRFLLSLRTENGQFYSSYHADGTGFGNPSSYFDGEALLALIKAAKYSPSLNLDQKLIIKSAEEMYKKNFKDALEIDPDSDIAKGFYQWGSMAYYELFTSGWRHVQHYADIVIELAWWMIYTHKVLKRKRNTSYAYEGLISAWEIARLTNQHDVMETLKETIDEGLYNLMCWQVEGPCKNDFLTEHQVVEDSHATGGIMNAKNDPALRIDVAQHQMHATLLALKHIYHLPQ